MHISETFLKNDTFCSGLGKNFKKNVKHARCFISNPSKIHRKSIKTVLRRPSGRIWEASRLQVERQEWEAFSRHLGDFGRHLRPQLRAKGCQNRAFGHQVASKIEKMRSRKGSQKKHDFLIEFWWENGRLGDPRPSILLGFYSVI